MLPVDEDHLGSLASDRSDEAGGLGFSLHLVPGDPRSVSIGGGASLSGSRPGENTPAFPKPGEVVAQFRIVSELGRGAFARVYLAEELELADRPVALKVSAVVGDEPQNLARLQHAHIVPIHSVRDDTQTGLRLICMPYVGGANLAEVLQTAETRSFAAGLMRSHATGGSLIEALDELNRASFQLAGDAGSVRAPGRPGTTASAVVDLAGGEPRTAPASPSQARSAWARYFSRFSWWSELEERVARPRIDEKEPARRYLRSVTFVQAGVWIAARLAEALEHAHERGILHRDLKPSNILIAADGTPMLLDFNLSASTTGTHEGARAQLGGTLPYMAPEHLDAFNPDGETPPEAVGPAADLYSLGLILFEMVTGAHPFAEPPDLPRLSETLQIMIAERSRGAPSAREFNPLVPWSLDSVLRKCLQPEVGRRYKRAGELAEDLRRILDDRPLRYAPEPSIRERIEKWSRRHPRASSSTTIGLVALVLLIAMGAVAWRIRDHLELSAARLHFQDFGRQFRDCQFLLSQESETTDHKAIGLLKSEVALNGYGVDQAGTWLSKPHVVRLAPEEQEILKRQVADLVELREWARVSQAADAAPEVRQRTWRQALAWLESVARFDPSPTITLGLERAEILDRLGDHDRAARLREEAYARKPSSARDYYRLGLLNLSQGRQRSDPAAIDRATEDLSQATALEPKGFWNWFLLGQCHYEQGRYELAAGDFAACTALAPEYPWPYFNRGQALVKANRLTEARLAYDQALERAPDFIEALVNRGLTLLEIDDLKPAEHDLARAIALGHHDPGVLAAHAEALSRLGQFEEAQRAFDDALDRHPNDARVLIGRGFARLRTDPEGAQSDFERVLEVEPGNVRARLGLAHLLRWHDPVGALRHLDDALNRDPNFGDALQLRALIRARQGDRLAVVDVDRLAAVPSPYRLYNAACALSLLSQATGQLDYADRSIELLGRAINLGFPREVASADADLAVLRQRPGYRRLFAGP